jgi:hypothetical protein
MVSQGTRYFTVKSTHVDASNTIALFRSICLKMWCFIFVDASASHSVAGHAPWELMLAE